MKTVEEIKQTLTMHKEELREKFKAKELMIFGSTVRGERKRKSNIDILVYFEEGADLFDLMGAFPISGKQTATKSRHCAQKSLEKRNHRISLKRDRSPMRKNIKSTSNTSPRR